MCKYYAPFISNEISRVGHILDLAHSISEFKFNNYSRPDYFTDMILTSQLLGQQLFLLFNVAGHVVMLTCASTGTEKTLMSVSLLTSSRISFKWGNAGRFQAGAGGREAGVNKE